MPGILDTNVRSCARWNCHPYKTVAVQRRTLVAKNGPKGGGREGAVSHRTQSHAPNGNWVKRDAQSGRFMDQKKGGEPFKGVRKER
jgi:hypothetical protein